MAKHKLDVIKKCDIPEKNFIKGNEIAIKEADKYLRKGKPVIFDGCFYHKSQIRHIIKSFQYKHFAFTLIANQINKPDINLFGYI